VSKKSDVWMPFYVTDYLGDTMHLNTTQHGAYVLMILAAWKCGGSLANDDAQLAAITRMSPEEWGKNCGVLKAFFRDEGEQLVHGRVVAEHQKAQAHSAAKAANGRLGGRPRKQSDSEEEAAQKLEESNRLAIAKANAKLHETPSPSPSPSSKEDIKTPPTPKGADVPSRFDEFWSFYPKKADRLKAVKAWDKAVRLADANLIITAARAYAKETAETDPKFVKHPATWLNAGSWGNGDPVQVKTDANRPAWAINAGFSSRFEAENAGCFERNASQFSGGQRAATLWGAA
jgi:uncharacterized protein YdaU (DUF1376 family)